MFNNDCKVASKVSNGYQTTVYGQLTQIGKQKPYFSVTHETWRATKKGMKDKRFMNPVSCGACGHETEKKFPALTDLFEFHLRDVSGQPMYTIENGAYYINHKEKEALANHLMISDDEAENIINACDNATYEEAQVYIKDYIDKNNLREVWKAKADNLIQKYGLKVSYER